VPAAGDPSQPGIDELLHRAAELARQQNALSFAVRVAATRVQLALEAGDQKAIESARSELAVRCRELPLGVTSSELEEARSASEVLMSPKRKEGNDVHTPDP
jgi:hypothetical protein